MPFRVSQGLKVDALASSGKDSHGPQVRTVWSTIGGAQLQLTLGADVVAVLTGQTNGGTPAFT